MAGSFMEPQWPSIYIGILPGPPGSKNPLKVFMMQDIAVFDLGDDGTLVNG